MSRGTAIALVLLLLLLGGYVLWPSGGYRPRQRLQPGPQPSQLLVRGFGYEQEVRDQRVHIRLADGHEWWRPASPGALTDLWKALTRVVVDPERQRVGVTAADLLAYGFSPDDPELIAGERRFRWHREGASAYLWLGHQQRLLPLSPRLVPRLDRAAQRLDARPLLPSAEPITAIQLADLELRLEQGRWQDVARPQRPALHPRVARLAKLLHTIPLRRFAGIEPGAVEQQGALIAGDQRYVFACGQLQTAEPWLRLGQQAPQRLSRRHAAELHIGLAELAIDRLVVLQPGVLGNPISRCLVERAGRDWFRLERRSESDQIDGESQWELRYDGGRVRARADTAERLLRACNAITLAEWQPGQLAPEPSTAPDAVLLRFPDLAGFPWLQLHGRQVRAAHGQGQADQLPELYEPLQRDDFLDTAVLRCAQERIRKIQRIGPDGSGEVYQRQRGGTWQRIHPAPGTPDSGAMQAFLSLVSEWYASRARLPTAADRELLQRAPHQIDLRIAAIELGMQQDELLLEQTVDRDWGLALAPLADGSWRAIDKLGDLAFTLPDDQVQRLLAPLDRRLLMPVLPGRINQLELERPLGQRVVFQRDGERWQARLAADAEARDADTVALRRLLQAITRFEYQAAADRAPQQVAARLQLQLPLDAYEHEVWELSIGAELRGSRLVELRRGRRWDAMTVFGQYLIDAAAIDHLAPLPERLLERP